MNDVVRIEYFIETSKINSTCKDVVEIDRATWEAMTPDQRDEEIKEYAFNDLSWGYKEIE